MTSKHDEAVAAAQRGWRVFPLYNWTDQGCSCGKGDACSSPGKHPMTKNGLKDATFDLTRVTEWWNQHPDANIGIRTGTKESGGSGIDALDIDGMTGEDSLAETFTFHGEPVTTIARTGGGGRHMLFKATGEGNRAGMLPKVDYRGNGGYIVAPVSDHKSGGTYEWLSSPDEQAPTEAPEWLLHLLSNKNSAGTSKPLSAAPLAGDIDDGMRNVSLTSLAGTMRRRGMDAEEIFVSLKVINERRVKPPLPDDTLWKIARSIGGKDPAAPIETVLFDRTDLGNGEWFAHVHGDGVRFDHRRDRWLLWNNNRWQPDTDGAVIRLAMEAARLRRQQAESIPDDNLRQTEIKWSLAMEQSARTQAMIRNGKSMKPLADSGESWDTDPWLLGVPNGVVDLRSGTLIEATQDQRITMQTAVPFDPNAECPVWMAHLQAVFEGNTDLIDYFHRAAGYSLSGVTSEEVLHVLWGRGSNGKTVTMETLRKVMGDYGQSAAFSTFEATRNGGGSSANNDVAALDKRRLVISGEPSEDSTFNESKLKVLTGGDTIRARYLYQEAFEFEATFKLWFAVNHKPKVRDMSTGLWRRMRLIPFTHNFENDPAKDLRIDEKLRAEWPGILRWLVQGCLAWQRDGLTPPATVTDATDEYRDESDPIAEFVAERCDIGTDKKVTTDDLYIAYCNWWEEKGLGFKGQLGKTGLSRKFSERFDQHRFGGKARGFIGVGLNHSPYVPVSRGEMVELARRAG